MTEEVIAFDGDDLLINTMYLFNQFYNEKYGTTFKFEDYWDFNLTNIWNISDNRIKELEREFHASHWGQLLEALEGAREIVCHLHNEGYRLPVITGRGVDLEGYLQSTLEKLFGLHHFSSVHHLGSGLTKNKTIPKYIRCLEEGASVLIDDFHGNLLPGVNYNIWGILVTKPWNKFIVDLPKKIIRVRNLYEAEEVIHKNRSLIWQY